MGKEAHHPLTARATKLSTEWSTVADPIIFSLWLLLWSSVGQSVIQGGPETRIKTLTPWNWELKPWQGREGSFGRHAKENGWKPNMKSLLCSDLKGDSVPSTWWMLVGGDAIFMYIGYWEIWRKKYVLPGMWGNYHLAKTKEKSSIQAVGLVMGSKDSLVMVSRTSGVKHCLWPFLKSSLRRSSGSCHSSVNQTPRCGCRTCGSSACWLFLTARNQSIQFDAARLNDIGSVWLYS